MSPVLDLDLQLRKMKGSGWKRDANQFQLLSSFSSAGYSDLGQTSRARKKTRLVRWGTGMVLASVGLWWESEQQPGQHLPPEQLSPTER